jgi:hypothetical protein
MPLKRVTRYAAAYNIKVKECYFYYVSWKTKSARCT